MPKKSGLDQKLYLNFTQLITSKAGLSTQSAFHGHLVITSFAECCYTLTPLGRVFKLLRQIPLASPLKRGTKSPDPLFWELKVLLPPIWRLRVLLPPF